ncbi:MAG: hypothetical protein JJT82_09585 [Legionellaceae bacterium]|nr:hypothetical protein [Legionellaceae bacterium]
MMVCLDPAQSTYKGMAGLLYSMAMDAKVRQSLGALAYAAPPALKVAGTHHHGQYRLVFID